MKPDMRKLQREERDRRIHETEDGRPDYLSFWRHSEYGWRTTITERTGVRPSIPVTVVRTQRGWIASFDQPIEEIEAEERAAKYGNPVRILAQETTPQKTRKAAMEAALELVRPDND